MTGRAQGIVMALLLSVMLRGISSVHGVSSRDSDYRVAASMLVRDRCPGEPILIQPREMSVPLLYYLLHGSIAPGNGRSSQHCAPDAPRSPASTREALPIGIAADGDVAQAVASQPTRRSWVVLDYRSALYGLSPNALGDRLGAAVLRDEFTADPSYGVRLALVERSGSSSVRTP